MFWLTVSLIGLWFAIHWLYPMGMAAKAKHDRGELTPYWWIMLLPAVVFGVVLDWAFNYTFGWIMFAESPFGKGLLFSNRVQHHFRNSMDWRWYLAAFWRRNLNVFDEGHIRP